MHSFYSFKALLKTSIKHGNETDWLRLLNKVNEVDSFSEKNLYLKALTATSNYNLLKM